MRWQKYVIQEKWIPKDDHLWPSQMKRQPDGGGQRKFDNHLL